MSSRAYEIPQDHATHGITSPILGPHVTGSHDALVVHEVAGQLAALVHQLADYEISAKLIHFVFDVGKEMGRLPFIQQADDEYWYLRPWRVRDGVQRDVQLREFGLYTSSILAS